MPSKYWVFALDDGTHTVELEYSLANAPGENVLLRAAENSAAAGPDQLLRPEVQDDAAN
jgi:hypothetical protein